MGIILRDGFDTYAGLVANNGLQASWSMPVTAQKSLVAGRFGGQALQFVGGANSSRVSRFFSSAASQLTVSFAGRFLALPSDIGLIQQLILRSGTTHMAALAFDNLGVAKLLRSAAYNSAVILGDSGVITPALSVWNYYELEIEISDTVGRMSLYRDTDLIANAVNVDNRNGTPTTVDNIDFGVSHGISSYNGGGTFQIDDLTVRDSSTRAGERRIETIYVNADGSTLNFTPSTGATHFGVVDEAQASLADYLSGSNVGDLDLLGLGNLSSTPATIDEINVMAYAQKTDAATRAIALGVKSGATTSDGSNFNQAVGFAKYERPIALDPNTGAAWTPAAVNALELQPKITV